MLLRFFVFVLLSIVTFLSCSKQESDNAFYQKIPDEKLDFYCTYLNNNNNFRDSSFMAFFYRRFNQLIAEKKLDSASQVLYLTGKTLGKHARYDADFVKVALDFLSEHEKEIPRRYFSGIYANIGNTYCDIGKFDTCTYYLKKGIVEPQDYYTYQNVAKANYYLLFGYLNNGKLGQSLESAFNALEMFEKQEDTVYQAGCYSGIACIYRYQDDYAEAEKYENKGFELMKETKDTSSLLIVSLNKISLYNQMEHPNLLPFIDSTVTIFKKWSEKTEDEKLSVNSWQAFKLTREKKLADAKKILDEIKPLTLKINDETSIGYYHNAISEYDVKMGKPSEEIDFYLKKIPEFKENEDYLHLRLFNQILYGDALAKGNFKEARKYLEDTYLAQDSLTNKALRIKVRELDKKYQTEKKEQQIVFQKKEINQKNTFIALLVAIVIGLITTLATFYLWQRQKTLKQEKESSMNFTKQLLENIEEERKRIAGDLHDSISHELLNLKSVMSQDIRSVSNKIDTIINDIRGISRNLHPVMFDKIGLVPNVEQLIERIQNQNNFFINSEINYAGSLSSADELQLYRIIQEALSNIIKYADAHAAKITIDELPKNIMVEIRDNGKGFNVKEALNSGKAFGLHNIIERSRVVGGEAQIESFAGSTIITINIPKKL